MNCAVYAYHLTSRFWESCYLQILSAGSRTIVEQRIHTSDNLDLSNTVRISENDTDLRWGGTLLCKLADLVDDLRGGGLQPRWRSAGVWDGGGWYALSVGMKTAHVGGLIELKRLAFVVWKFEIAGCRRDLCETRIVRLARRPHRFESRPIKLRLTLGKPSPENWSEFPHGFFNLSS
jgi:hypothetical protein